MNFWMVSGIDLPWNIKPLLQILLKCVVFFKEMSARPPEGATDMLRKFNRLKIVAILFSSHQHLEKWGSLPFVVFLFVSERCYDKQSTFFFFFLTDTNLKSNNVREEKRLVCVRQWTTTTTTTCFGCKSSQLWFRCAVETRQAANWLLFFFLSKLTASLANV